MKRFKLFFVSMAFVGICSNALSAPNVISLPTKRMVVTGDGSKSAIYDLVAELKKQKITVAKMRIVQLELKVRTGMAGASLGLMEGGISLDSKTLDGDLEQTLVLDGDNITAAQPWYLVVRGDLQLLDLKITLDDANSVPISAPGSSKNNAATSASSGERLGQDNVAPRPPINIGGREEYHRFSVGEEAYYVDPASHSVVPIRILSMDGASVLVGSSRDGSRATLSENDTKLAKSSYACAKGRICTGDQVITSDRYGRTLDAEVIAVQSTHLVVLRISNGTLVGDWPVSALQK